MNRILNQPSGLSALSEGLELKVPDRNCVKAHDINGALKITSSLRNQKTIIIVSI